MENIENNKLPEYLISRIEQCPKLCDEKLKDGIYQILNFLYDENTNDIKYGKPHIQYEEPYLFFQDNGASYDSLVGGYYDNTKDPCSIDLMWIHEHNYLYINYDLLEWKIMFCVRTSKSWSISKFWKIPSSENINNFVELLLSIIFDIKEIEIDDVYQKYQSTLTSQMITINDLYLLGFGYPLVGYIMFLDKYVSTSGHLCRTELINLVLKNFIQKNSTIQDIYNKLDVCPWFHKIFENMDHVQYSPYSWLKLQINNHFKD